MEIIAQLWHFIQEWISYMRSFELNLEVTTVWYSLAAVVKLRTVEASYMARSQPVNLAVWRQRPFRKRFAENIARLFAAMV